MPRFKPYNYDQDARVVINYRHQLQPGTFEYAVHYLIEQEPTSKVAYCSAGTARRNTAACTTPVVPITATGQADR